MIKRITALLLLLALFIPLAACQPAEREKRNYYLTDDFEGQAVGILEDSGLRASVEDRIPGAKIKTYKSLDSAAKALKNHKVETLILDANHADALINKDDTFAKVLEVYQDNKSFVASLTIGNTSSGEFRAGIDATLSLLKGNGEYYNLIEKYFFNEAPSVSDAGITLNQTTINREVIIGISENAPFAYKNDSGEWAGFDIEIANAIAKHYGATPIFKEYKKEELISAMEAGEIRMAMGQFTEKESEEWEHPINPSAYYDNSIYMVSNKVDVGINPFTGK